MKTCILRDDIVFRVYILSDAWPTVTHPFSSMTCIQFHMHTCLRQRCIGTTACIHTRTLSPKVYIHRPTHSTRLSSTPAVRKYIYFFLLESIYTSAYSKNIFTFILRTNQMHARSYVHVSSIYYQTTNKLQQ